MNAHRRRLLACLSALPMLGGLVATPAVAADAYPERPITLVVPSGPGGITDLLARDLGARLAGLLKQPIVIDNRAGASGVIGSSWVARAKPDGYTLLMAFPSHVINPSITPNLPYDTAKDFASVAKVGTAASLMLVGADSPVKSVADFIAMAREKPGALNYGTVGSGSLGELTMLLLQSKAGLKLLSVPYKGDPQILTALAQGDIHTFLSPASSMALVNGGKLRAVGTASPKRLPVMPDVPTLAESGVPGFAVEGWSAIFAPAGTPTPIVKRLNDAINEALKDPALVSSFHAKGVSPIGGSPQDLQQSVETEIAFVRDTLQSAGAKP